MTRISDALIKTMYDMGYGTHIITSRDSSIDPYAPYLQTEVGRRQGRVVTKGEVKKEDDIPEGLSGIVIFDKTGLNDRRLDHSVAHEYVHVRDLQSDIPLDWTFPPGTKPNVYEKITELRKSLILPRPVTTEYLAYADEQSSTSTMAPLDKIYQLVEYAQSHGGADNPVHVFESLMAEFQPFYEQAEREQNKLYEGVNAILLKIPLIGLKLRNWYSDKHIDERTSSYNTMLKELPPHLSLMTMYNRVASPRISHFQETYYWLNLVKAIEQDLQEKGIPLVPPILETIPEGNLAESFADIWGIEIKSVLKNFETDFRREIIENIPEIARYPSEDIENIPEIERHREIFARILNKSMRVRNLSPLDDFRQFSGIPATLENLSQILKKSYVTEPGIDFLVRTARECFNHFDNSPQLHISLQDLGIDLESGKYGIFDPNADLRSIESRLLEIEGWLPPESYQRWHNAIEERHPNPESP